MALRSVVTRLLSTSQKSVAVTAARTQGTAAAASRGACEISCLTILDNYSKIDLPATDRTMTKFIEVVNLLLFCT